MSQGDLAQALGVSRQTVISIESGRYLPSLPLAFAIARFFNLTVDTIFGPDQHAVSPGRCGRTPHSLEEAGGGVGG
jgi:putative transcriptional regulator